MQKNEIKDTRYYAKWPGVKEQDFDMEINQIGLISYRKIYANGTPDSMTRRHVFYPAQGFSLLEHIITSNREDILEATEIVSSNGKVYSVENFLKSLENVEFYK